MRRTSGHRLEPPMPSRSASLNPALQTSLARFRNSTWCASCSSVMSNQPSHLASSSPVQSEESRSHRRRILPPDCQSPMAVLTAVATASGREDLNRLTQFFLLSECSSPPHSAAYGRHRQTV